LRYGKACIGERINDAHTLLPRPGLAKEEAVLSTTIKFALTLDELTEIALQ